MASRPATLVHRLAPARRRWLRSSRRALVALASVAVVVPFLTAMAAPPSGVDAGPVYTPHPQHQRLVPVHAVPGRKARIPAMPLWHRPAVVWPAAGSAVARLHQASATAAAPASSPGDKPLADPSAGSPNGKPLAGPSAGSARAGTMPVWTGPAVPGSGQAALAAPASLRVSMASRAVTAAAGVKGLVFSVARADGAAGAAAVHVSVSYREFAAAYGGYYASRLRLVELPACALTTPRAPGCLRQTPLASANDVQAAELGANVTLAAPAASAGAAGNAQSGSAASAPAPSVVLAAAASTSGSGGDFTATPLSEAGTWSAGGSSGAFTYSYPVTVPPVPGGLAPSVSLDYNSQAVDGLTSSTNNQASWIGDGWNYSPGYVERGYTPCSREGKSTGDLCWSANDTTTIWLNGSATTLVDGANGWYPEADNGEKVQYLTGAANGTNPGDYWVITDPDGTKYYFGMNQLPGYASGDAATNSTWTVPLYYASNGSGQSCYNSTFSQSHCVQAWRWNLDYVTDSHGDAMAYFYNKETNYYGADGATTGTASYTRGGVPTRIEYGLRAGAVYGATPAGQVNFTTSAVRTDVPSDLSCSSGATCNVGSPTFWSKDELDSISTQALKGSALASVDSWALKYTYPATGDANPPLWLSTITRTGQDGTSVPLPPVTFAGKALPNRVETSADTNSGYTLLARVRLETVTNETGGGTTIVYATPSGPCTGSGSFPAPDANTLLCYPDYWTPSGMTSPILDWFNKYVVSQVTQTDTTGGGQAEVTNYGYAGAAWHYDDDALTRSANRTWDLWRGYQTVTTTSGTAPDPVTKTTDTYFQGMDGDYQSGGGTSSASLTSHGTTVTDSDQFAGVNFEHTVYNGASLVSDTVTTAWTSASQATQTQPSPLPSLQAYMTGSKETDTYTTLASGGSRESQVINTHDSYGRVTSVSSVPDTTDATQDTCTTTAYATNTSAWVLDLPSEVQVVSVPCGTTPALPANAVSDTLAFYDGATTLAGDVPAAGNVTSTQLATSYNGATPVYTTQSQATYDEYGRVLTSKDADSHLTTTAYTPATGAEPTSESVTDPMGLVTTTTYDQARDLPLTVTNPAGWVTTKQYDALGRLTSVWTPGHPTSGPAEYTYSYQVLAGAPSVVTTNTLEPAGTYLPSETLYDSLGRVRETQTGTADGNRVISDTVYNSDGWKLLVSHPYPASGAPSATLVAAQDSKVPSQTGYVYDGAGRVTRQISYSFASDTWETDTTYGGNYVTTVPPTGGTSQTTFTDGRGLETAMYQYHSGVSADPSGPASGYDKTTYSYTPAGKLASIKDAAGNSWSSGYDLAGDQTSEATPDSGTTTSSYDAAGQLMSVTDARTKQISYTYDADGRKTAAYDTTGGAAENSSDQTAGWVYDTVAKGQLTSSTSYSGGNAYTEEVASYNGYGLPAATETIIPAAQGKLAGTYIQEDTYTTTGQLQKYTDVAGGGLPTEIVGYSYDSAGEQTGMTGTWAYVDSLSYSELGQPLEYTMGSSAEPAWITDSWDQQTGRLSESQTAVGTTGVVVGDIHYKYDASGNVLSESDTPSGGTTNVQCFSYDYLGRLAQAWAQGSAGCAASPSQSAEGGPAPYWDSYAYNVQDNLTSVTSTPPTGSAVTTTNTYNPPGAGSVQPHAVQSSATTGSAATTYGYDAAGHTTAINSTSKSEGLTWNDSGQLASLSSSGMTTAGYVYDASGNLLIQSDPGQVTLYLPDAQIVENTATGTVTGTRFYTLGGVTLAARSSAGTVSYLTGDQQGTAAMSIDSATLAVTRRYYDPYGNPIGAAPGSWPGTKGFVGGTADAATGLTNLGAREYSPGTGSFVTTDPVLDPYNPQDLNPYAYASDNPATSSDPSGLCDSAGCPKDPCGPGYGGGGCDGNHSGPAPGDGTTSSGSPAPSQPVGVYAPGYNPNPFLGAGSPPPVERTPRVLIPHQASTGSVDGPGCNPFLFKDGACPSERGAAGTTPQEVRSSAIGALGVLLGALPIGDLLDAAIGSDIGSSVLDGIAASCGGESFTPATRVLLASGVAVPIASLRTGDKVLATNTRTGKTQAEPVTAVLVHHDTNRYNVTVRTGHHRNAVIHTTTSHLFWNPAAGRWVKAAELRPGSSLRMPEGATAAVLDGYTPVHQTGWMWDLTVTTDHDFYITAAGTAVLVHNCPMPEGAPQAQEIIQSAARAQAAQGVDALKTLLSPAERAAMEDDPGLTSRMLGQAVHRATADALEQDYPGRFIYRTRGPDFVDTTTGEMLELTTPGEVGSHLARPGYGGVTMCTYALPAC